MGFIQSLLKEQASLHGISAGAEHRNILKQVLTRPSKKSFVEVFSEMPDVGSDEDFKRIQDSKSRDIFD